MSTATLTSVAPIRGCIYDKNDPATRGPWLEQRRGGITATEIRDWGIGSKQRQIITAKVTGEFEDLSGNAYVNHGNLREPIIAEWVRVQYGIEPCDHVYSHGGNPRHLASPDGISLDPFTRELEVGTDAAILSEIKTSSSDLTPGTLDATRTLVTIEPGSPFDRKGYYTQMQWQMYVMNAVMTLFVYEQRDDVIDPETGTFSPIGVPQVAWIPRDQALIDRLVNNVAPAALAKIDAARSANTGDMPPASDLPAEHAILVADLLAARQAEAVAKAKKEAAFAALKAAYAGEDKPDVRIDAGGAWVTVSTSTKEVQRFDEATARKKAPAHFRDHDRIVKRYTTPVPTTTQSFTVTEKKGTQK